MSRAAALLLLVLVACDSKPPPAPRRPRPPAPRAPSPPPPPPPKPEPFQADLFSRALEARDFAAAHDLLDKVSPGEREPPRLSKVTETLQRKEFDAARAALPRGIDRTKLAHTIQLASRATEDGSWGRARALVNQAASLHAALNLADRIDREQVGHLVAEGRAAAGRKDWPIAGARLKTAFEIDGTSETARVFREEMQAGLTAALEEALPKEDWAAAYELVGVGEPIVRLPPDKAGAAGFNHFFGIASRAFGEKDWTAAHEAARHALEYTPDHAAAANMLARTETWVRRGEVILDQEVEGNLSTSMAARGGLLCFGTDAGVAYAMPLKRDEFFDFRMKGPVRGDPLILGDELFMGDETGTLLRADLKKLTGLLIEIDGVGGPIRGLAAVPGILFVWDGKTCSAVDLSELKKLWAVPCTAQPVAVDGVVYITGETLGAFEIRTGKPRWRLKQPSKLQVAWEDRLVVQAAVLKESDRTRLWSHAGVQRALGGGEGLLYFWGQDRTILSLKQDSLGKVGSVRINRDAPPEPVIAGGVLFGTAGSEIFALDAHGGGELWTFKTAGPAMPPAVLGDRVAFGGGARVYVVYSGLVEGGRWTQLRANAGRTGVRSR